MISCVSRPLLAVIQASGGRSGATLEGPLRWPQPLQQAFKHGVILARRWQPRQDALTRRQQAFVTDRLQKVIHRALLERVDGVLVIGGDEHHLGARAQLGQRTRNFDATDAGHADVEERDVRLRLGQLLQRTGAVLALGHQLQLRPQPAQLFHQ